MVITAGLLYKSSLAERGRSGYLPLRNVSETDTFVQVGGFSCRSVSLVYMQYRGGERPSSCSSERERAAIDSGIMATFFPLPRTPTGAYDRNKIFTGNKKNVCQLYASMS